MRKVGGALSLFGDRVPKEKIQEFKNRLKTVNPDFEEGILYPDTAFKYIAGVIDEPSEIIFGIRYGGNLMLGTSDNIYFIVLPTLKNPNPERIVPWENIDFIKIEEGFATDKLIIGVLGDVITIDKLAKKQSRYAYNNIQPRINRKQVDCLPREREIKTGKNTRYNLKDIRFEVIASDLEKEFKLKTTKDEIYFEKNSGFLGMESEKVYISGNIVSIEQITEENKKSLLKKAGWGFAGAVVGGLFTGGLAVAGLLAGVIAKGNKKEICFACELKNGHRFIAVTDNENYQKIVSLNYL